MNKLAALVLKHKAKRYGIPENQGWMTRQQAARQLGTTERNVQDLLRDAIAAKDIQVQKFSEWDAATMRPVSITCYRIAADIPTGKSKPPATTTSIPGIPEDLLPKVREKIAQYPNKTASGIRDLFSSNNRRRLSTAAIRSILPR